METGRTKNGRGKRRGKKWLKGCGIGCVVLLVVAVIILAVTWITILGVSNRAVETREQVEAAHRTQKEFTPPLDDAIPAARLERFLVVRRELAPFCEPMSAFGATFQSVDERATKLDEQEEEPSDAEVVGFFAAAGSLLKGFAQLGHQLGEYSVVRNETLLENEMGLGEYTWIYVMAYYSWLGHQPQKFALEKEPYPRVFYDRVLGDVRGMVERHVTDLEAALATSDVSADAHLLARLALWRDELQAMEADVRRIPFPGDLPPELSTSLAPFREQFEELYCPATGELDITRTEKDGFKFEHR